jgi:hypothetical protein
MDITFDEYGRNKNNFNMIPVMNNSEYHLHIHYKGSGTINITDDKNNLLYENKIKIEKEIVFKTLNSKYLFIEFQNIENIENIEIINMYLNGEFNIIKNENKFTIKYKKDIVQNNKNKDKNKDLLQFSNKNKIVFK